eukprot:1197020-Pyramimonas_sp.AAC.1
MALGSIQDPRKRPRDPDLLGKEGLHDIRFPSGPTCCKINAQIHDAIAREPRAVAEEKLRLPGRRSVRADKVAPACLGERDRAAALVDQR